MQSGKGTTLCTGDKRRAKRAKLLQKSVRSRIVNPD